MQIIRQSLNLGIAYIAPIQETQQIQQSQHWKKSEVHFPQDFFLVYITEIDVVAGPVGVVMCECVVGCDAHVIF
jgi:hypothetical protein